MRANVWIVVSSATLGLLVWLGYVLSAKRYEPQVTRVFDAWLNLEEAADARIESLRRRVAPLMSREGRARRREAAAYDEAFAAIVASYNRET